MLSDIQMLITFILIVITLYYLGKHITKDLIRFYNTDWGDEEDEIIHPTLVDPEHLGTTFEKGRYDV